MLLTRDGCVVTTAGDGSEALRAVRDDPGVCVVFLDYRLPDVDAETLAVGLRAATADRAVLVLVTGDMEGAAKLRGVVRDAVLKPIDPDAIGPLVARHCAWARDSRP